MILHLRPLIGLDGSFLRGPRMDEPYDAYARRFPDVHIHSENPTKRFYIENDRIFIFQRSHFNEGEAEKSMRHMLMLGYVVVFDIDDHPNAFEGDLMLRTFEAVHAVQVSTAALAEAVRPYNPEVAVFPNQLPVIPPLPPFRADGPLEILYAAFNRRDSWEPLLEPISRILRDLHGLARLTVMTDQEFFDAVDAPDKRFVPLGDHAAYTATMLQADVVLAPLIDTEFNRSKSDLKFIECAARGVVLLGSPTVYQHSLRHDETGLIFKTPEELAEQLTMLALDRSHLGRLRDNAYAYVTERRLVDDHVGARHAWHRSLLRRRETLTQALLARRPELAPTETLPVYLERMRRRQEARAARGGGAA